MRSISVDALHTISDRRIARSSRERRLNVALIALFAGFCLFGLFWQVTHPLPQPSDMALMAP